MNQCSGCRMDHETVKCLFQSDVEKGFISVDVLHKCPCRNCIVKPTCAYKYCSEYESYYNELFIRYQLYKTKNICGDRGVDDCMSRILKISW
jgi:hypothetical protein